MLDDEVFFSHGMGSHHLNLPPFHRYLRRMAPFLAGSPPRRLLGVDEACWECARCLYLYGTPGHCRRARQCQRTLQKLPSSFHACSPFFIGGTIRLLFLRPLLRERPALPGAETLFLSSLD
jgi:hypothetical protein